MVSAMEEAAFASGQMMIRGHVLVYAPYPLGNDDKYFPTRH